MSRSRFINGQMTKWSLNQSVSVYSASKLRKQKLRGFYKNLKSNKLQRLVDIIIYNWKIWNGFHFLVMLVYPSLNFILIGALYIWTSPFNEWIITYNVTSICCVPFSDTCSCVWEVCSFWDKRKCVSGTTVPGSVWGLCSGGTGPVFAEPGR